MAPSLAAAVPAHKSESLAPDLSRRPVATFNEQAKAIMTCDLRRQSCVRRVTEQGVCCFMIGTRFSNLYTAVDTPAEAMVDRELCSKSESDL